MKLSIITQFRDEAKYLKEWIEFHLLVGIDKFYMINHMSSDDPHSVLKPYINKGIVILIDVMEEFSNYERPGFYNEVNLVTNSIPRLHKLMELANTDWVMFLNTDEFLYPATENNIKDVLIKYPENIGQISVNWRLMGNCNYELKEGELLTEKLTKQTITDNDRHVKSIVRKKAYQYLRSVHYCDIKSNYKTCDGNGHIKNITPQRYETHIPVYDNLIINHYVLRDLTYTKQKLSIYKMWGRQIDEEEYSNRYNEQTTLDIQRFVKKLKERI